MFRSGLFVVPFVLLSVGCSTPEPLSSQLMAELRQMQESQNIYIGFVNEPREEVRIIDLDGKPDSGTSQISVAKSNIGKIRAADSHASFFGEVREPLHSPDGKRVVRESQGDLIVEDVEQGMRRVIARNDRVKGLVHWSPDSEFILYVEQAGRWDPTGLSILDDIIYVSVYRARDGERGPLRWFGQGAAGMGWEWLHIPSEVLRPK